MTNIATLVKVINNFLMVSISIDGIAATRELPKIATKTVTKARFLILFKLLTSDTL